LNGLDDLRERIGRITPVDDRERLSITLTLDRLMWGDDVFSEELNDHHVTASAFVVSSRGVVLHLHRRLGIWVQPGGHVDPGESPESAAVRETLEETGLLGRHLDPVELFNVDVHPGPRGHTHYDLRYVLVADPVDPAPHEGESLEVFWFAFESAQRRCEPALAAAIKKLGEFVDSREVRDSSRE
jgi:8-oxo-dGTP pyrophosphatase MutT (NUDIX family)